MNGDKFVIVGGARGWFVAPPGRAHSYTPDILKAKIYASRYEAECDKCGNETVIPLSDLFTAVQMALKNGWEAV